MTKNSLVRKKATVQRSRNGLSIAVAGVNATDSGLVAKKRYPSLPKTVAGAGGLLTIRVVEKPNNSDANMGYHHPDIRVIEIAKYLSPDQKWSTLFHELTHAALWDTGLHNALTHKLEEQVCDAVAVGRFREKFG